MLSFIRNLSDRLMKAGDVQRQSFLHFGTSISVTVLGFLSTMAVTHLAGSPDIPGGYFLFLAYLGIFSLISSGGLGGAAIYMMGRDTRGMEYFSAYLLLRGILLAGSILLICLAAPFMIDLSSAGLVPWLIVAIATTSVAEIAGTWLYGTGKAGYIQVSGLINNLVRIIVQVLAIIAGYGVAGLAGSMIAGIIAGALYLIPLCRFRPVVFPWKIADDLLRFSFWALLASGGMVIYGNIDTILLGYFASTTEVGLYRIALQLASFALFSALALNTILYPKFASWQMDERRAWISGSLARALSYSLLLALPVCIGGAFLGDRLLYFLYGSPYEEAGAALTLLLAAQVVYVFVFLWTMTLSALGKPRDAAIAALTALAVNVPLNLILIPVFGITGAASAILITVFIHAISAGKLLGKYVILTVDYRALRSIGIAVAGMTVLTITIEQFIPLTHIFSLAGTVFISGIVYFFILVRLERGIDTALRRMMQDMGFVLPEWV